MSAPTKTFLADPVRLPDVYTVPDSLRCTVVPVEDQSNEKIIGLLKWLLDIARERKREAAA